MAGDGGQEGAAEPRYPFAFVQGDALRPPAYTNYLGSQLLRSLHSQPNMNSR